jgi:hypothetical protein
MQLSARPASLPRENLLIFSATQLLAQDLDLTVHNGTGPLDVFRTVKEFRMGCGHFPEVQENLRRFKVLHPRELSNMTISGRKMTIYREARIRLPLVGCTLEDTVRLRRCSSEAAEG